MKRPKHLKARGDLTLADLKNHPIWTLYDDDDDDVVPVDYPGWTTEAVGGEGMFAACDFTFNDGTVLPGAVGINIYSNSPYVFKFPRDDGKFMSFPVNNQLENEDTRQELAQFVGKQLQEVFPIRYVTPFVLPNGIPLVGKHD